ncbi:peptidase [Bacillus massiliglaciei]|uniref:peptidase n=1 Tax=Bacillus massiliglaciei TaxID=1816693 RepID=UPI000AB7CC07|nr:peptidase [Bacillus massiliglaciei]
MNQLEKRTKDWIAENKQVGVKLLQNMIQAESLRGNEAAAQEIVARKCREIGFDVDLWEIGDEELLHHPQFHCDREDFSGNPNLAAVKKGTGGGNSLILNGHIDVVPEGNRDDWTLDPFSGVVKEGKVFGRGATDMKGGNAALLLAMQAISALGIQLQGDLIFQSVIEEESGGAGTLAAVLRGYKADGAIIPEPTNMKLFPLQQGSMWFRLTVKGKSAHGGTRYEGVNAIDQAAIVIKEIRNLETRRNAELKNHPLYQTVPIPVPINIGKMSSGTWPSSVPDKAVLEGRFGIAPNETPEAAQKCLEDLISALNSGSFSEFPVELEWFGARWLPGQLELDHPLMTALSTSYSNVMGTSPVIEASPWGTDGGYLSAVGGIPVVVFGPGETKMAHDADEYIEIDRMIEAAKVIAVTILRWCGVDEAVTRKTAIIRD